MLQSGSPHSFLYPVRVLTSATTPLLVMDKLGRGRDKKDAGRVVGLRSIDKAARAYRGFSAGIMPCKTTPFFSSLFPRLKRANTYPKANKLPYSVTVPKYPITTSNFGTLATGGPGV